MKKFLSILLALSLFSAVLTAKETAPSAPAFKQALAVQQAPTAGAQQSTDLFADVSAQKASDQELEQAEGKGVVGALVKLAIKAAKSPAVRRVVKNIAIRVELGLLGKSTDHHTIKLDAVSH